VREARGFDLVVFDCDGVLVDSERLSIRLDVELLAALGWPMTEAEIVEHFVGRTDAAMRAEIEEHLGRDVSAEWDAFAKHYLAAFAAELEPVDGAAAAVDAIQGAGYTTCVASSGDHGKIGRPREDRPARPVRRPAVQWRRRVNGKPAPDLFLRGGGGGRQPARAAVVEDSRHGSRPRAGWARPRPASRRRPPWPVRGRRCSPTCGRCRR
jgi:beta-phosphoglucomutase-like phosphatase (HAD superfamily)